MRVTMDHVAAGGNAISNALSANRALPESLVVDASVLCAAYGAKNGVALVARDPRTPSLLRICDVLQHRHATRDATRITSVYLHAPPRCDATADATHRVLAGDSEGNVLLWSQPVNHESPAWTLRPLFSPDGQKIATESVSAVTAIRTRRRWLYFAAFSNGHVAVFAHALGEEDAVACVTILKLGVKMIMETLATTTWTAPCHDADGDVEEDVLVAAGGVDSKVYLFELAHETGELKHLIALEGHRGWIRAVDFERRAVTAGSASATDNSLFLASASQDHRVRLWKISAVARERDHESGDVVSTTASATSAGFQAVGATSLYTVSFDSLLIAHEDWVTSLVWTLVPGISSADQPNGGSEETAALVSTSMDNTMIVWKKKNAGFGSNGAWVPSLRVGEHGGNGVLSSVVLPSTQTPIDLLALNLSGQLERWLEQPAPSKIFLPAAAPTGHTSPVTDISWAPRGDYLISLSLDQTTRVLAPWRANGSWHEISRAQVHGYDINCGAFISKARAEEDRDGHNDRFVCGADEKILRIFEAPDNIQALVKALNDEDAVDKVEGVIEAAARIEHAYLPELSLTNKSTVKKAEKGKSQQHQGAYATLGESSSIRLPVGDTLAKKTLWPEQRKLYGHGNELLCVTSNHAGTLLASACKSREEKFAAVWLWNTSDWSAAQAPLEGHKSSVVQLAFSPNDEYLVSVSKDRQFCVFARHQGQDSSSDSYTLMDRVKAHKRIIWSCSWTPDSSMFATGSRDQTFALWAQMPGQSTKWVQRGAPVAVDSAVTAVAFAPLMGEQGEQDQQKKSYVLAVGLESGAISLYAVVTSTTDDGASSVQCKRMAQIESQFTPSSTVSRLSWSPATHPVSDSNSESNSKVMLLACASSDHSVRVYRVHESALQ